MLFLLLFMPQVPSLKRSLRWRVPIQSNPLRLASCTGDSREARRGARATPHNPLELLRARRCRRRLWTTVPQGCLQRLHRYNYFAARRGARGVGRDAPAAPGRGSVARGAARRGGAERQGERETGRHLDDGTIIVTRHDLTPSVSTLSQAASVHIHVNSGLDLPL